MEDIITFRSPKNKSSIIKVIGVGGGGNNAVNHMYNQGIAGVDFIICNTDMQALEMSPVPNKIYLGKKGLGAGSIPSVGKKAALEKSEEIKEILKNNTEMLFITAGMGGGTGTGAAPVIAQLSKEIDLACEDVQKILTVAIVTIPFSFEGRKRNMQAIEGIKELRQFCDAVLIISNDKLRELYGDLPLTKAFAKADNILLTAAKGIAEIITVKAVVNIDFKDVNTVMRNSGVAIMGTGSAEGENRAREAIEIALTSPLLNDNNIKGTNNILLYLASGEDNEIYMDEITEITEFIIAEAGSEVEIIWGVGKDNSLDKKINVTVVATGFNQNEIDGEAPKKDKIVHVLDKKLFDDTVADNDASSEINVNEIELFTINKTIKNPPLSAEKKAFVSDQEIFNTMPNFMTHEVKKPVKKILSSATAGELFPDNKPYRKTSGTPSTIKGKHIINEKKMDIKTQERIKQLKDLSIKLKTPGGLSELENEPAYVRRNVKLSEGKPSSDKIISRYSLSEDEEDNIELKSDNSYLHDNVD